jgi:UDP-N-acetylmuramate--alanine ligase
VHFIGVGGSGMSGLAELLVRTGHEVSGSDLRATAVTDRLARLGVAVHVGHDAAHVGAAERVVFSSAIRPDNPELIEARRLAIPLVARGELLAELMQGHYAIAVAGAHGKTTTTSMIAWVLERAGWDPTAVIGGRLRAFDSSIRVGAGRWFVAEADESDRSFLKMRPTLAVVTNLDDEHMESYEGFDDLRRSFLAFANGVPADGAVVVCLDDERLRDDFARLNGRRVTYALDRPDADIFATDVRSAGFEGSCRVWSRRGGMARALGALSLTVAGRHNLQNALAAVAAAEVLGVPFATVAEALRTFGGAERRFERRGEERGVLVIDDYGHHPTEVAAVLASAERLGRRRVLVAFQPHRYSRTKLLLDRFGPALSAASVIWLADIYGAGEDPIPGVTIERLAEAVRRTVSAPVHVVVDFERLAPLIAGEARAGDVVVTLGAGSIGVVGDRLLAELRRGAAGPVVSDAR